MLRLLPIMLILAACGPSLRAPASTPGAAASGEAVERYLQLVAERNYHEMAWVFGTREGAYIRQVPQRDAELLMYLHACLLRNDRFGIRSERPVPGAVGAMEYQVRLTKSSWEGEVAFRTVRGSGGRWFVENVALETITSSAARVPQECVNQLRARQVR